MESHPDRVSELPGWNQPLPSRLYSGYLDYEFHGQQVHTHYILLEAEQIGDCNCDKPLIYWVRDMHYSGIRFFIFLPKEMCNL